MASDYRNRKKNLSSSAWRVLKSVGRAADGGASGLARWATTDHYGFGRRLQNMPVMGWLDTLRYAFMLLVAQILSALVAAVLTGLLIAFGIPLLISMLLGY
jgi:hypothetical protein